MRIDVLLKLLAAKSANVRVDDKFISELQHAEELLKKGGFPANGEVDVEEKEDPHYELHLSEDTLSPTQKSAIEVIDQNHRELNRNQSFGQVAKPQVPTSMTASLEAPKENFEAFMQKLTADLDKLADAHSSLDRDRALHLLLEDQGIKPQ